MKGMSDETLSIAVKSENPPEGSSAFRRMNVTF
jgi:hypothetical protein